jgi:hypothetical protein
MTTWKDIEVGLLLFMVYCLYLTLHGESPISKSENLIISLKEKRPITPLVDWIEQTYHAKYRQY